ncbi:chromate efflux transporter [Paraburkholderia ribeironis]|nr:chromate efflux transporter [Paraburkholderia ribeironis]
MRDANIEAPVPVPAHSSAWALFCIFLRLGLTSFGGPAAHLGNFRNEFVARRRWLDEHTFGEVVALCQFLPGPASSQAGVAIGRLRGGIAGAIAAWLGFTMPSVLLLVALAYGFTRVSDATSLHLLRGPKIAAVAVIVQAVWSMGRMLCPDRARATIAATSAISVIVLGAAYGQVVSIVAAGLAGAAFPKSSTQLPGAPLGMPGTKAGAIACLAAFALLLFGLPAAAAYLRSYPLDLFAAFYRAGSLVFGGGHAVLPVLEAIVVPRGWVARNIFMAGYGAAQAVPGPLFSFAAFLGAASTGHPAGVAGALIAMVAIFLPSFLLVGAALPLWGEFRAFAPMRRVMAGINAAVVGILLAALYDPVWTSAVHSGRDFALVITALVLLGWWRVPSWAVVVITAALAAWVV